MRTTKRFTPKVLDRFRREDRGIGVFNSYTPWHRVGRSDPSSRGRSHLFMWTERQRELLSDGELDVLLFCSMLPNVLDLREQYPLVIESCEHELSAYFPDAFRNTFPGTQQIATDLGHKQARINGDGRSTQWIMTTDILLTLQDSCGRLNLLAISKKPTSNIPKSQKRLLEIEQAYWKHRGVPWLLITPDLYNEKVSIFLRNVWPWALGEPVSKDDIVQTTNLFNANYGHSLSHILNHLENHFGCMGHAQRAFWQSVWFGNIPIDLNRSWRPHIPPRLLPLEAFLAQNPIALRRSAWN